jgi:hypothetical protein
MLVGWRVLVAGVVTAALLATAIVSSASALAAPVLPGTGGTVHDAIPAWWTLYSGLIVLLVAFGLRGLLRRR